MLAARDDGGGGLELLPPAPLPSPPQPVPLPPAAAPAPSPVSSEPRNANGETLAQAEAAVLAEVAAGALGADALARHPLPPGTSQAEALRFLASLPQTTYVLGQPGGTVTGPPIGTGGDNPPEDPSIDLSGGGGDRELESVYRPAGVVATWRELVNVFRTDVPRAHSKVNSANKALLGVFK